MPQRVVGKLRIKHTTDRVEIDSSIGICAMCMEELASELRELLGFSVPVQGVAGSHIIVTIWRRLPTRRRGLVMDLVNDKIDLCLKGHEGYVDDEL